MEGQITIDQWLQWKEDIRNKLRETAGNFVYIGYRLKQIRDSEMLDGCADIFEFAQKEYGLGKSVTSRFIAINEKFSIGGNSEELKPEYANIGSSKLSEMLSLPDNECEMITEHTTVKEIREYKEFLRQEIPEPKPLEPAERLREEAVATSQRNDTKTSEDESVSEQFEPKLEQHFTEVVPENTGLDQKIPENQVSESEIQENLVNLPQMESENPPKPAFGQGTEGIQPVATSQQEKVLSPLQKCLEAFFEDKEEALDEILKILRAEETEENLKRVAELMNPGGYTTFKKGICYLTLDSYDMGVRYKVLTEPAVKKMTYKEMLLEVAAVFEGFSMWANYYRKPVIEQPEKKEPEKAPEKEEPKPLKAAERLREEAVATSQQNTKETSENESVSEQNEPKNDQNETENAQNVTETAENEPETIPSEVSNMAAVPEENQGIVDKQERYLSNRISGQIKELDNMWRGSNQNKLNHMLEIIQDLKMCIKDLLEREE